MPKRKTSREFYDAPLNHFLCIASLKTKIEQRNLPSDERQMKQYRMLKQLLVFINDPFTGQLGLGNTLDIETPQQVNNDYYEIIWGDEEFGKISRVKSARK